MPAALQALACLANETNGPREINTEQMWISDIRALYTMPHYTTV